MSFKGESKHSPPQQRLADTTDFLKPPADKKGSMDSHWGRLTSESRRRIALSKSVELLKRMRRKSDVGNGTAVPSTGPGQLNDS
jgi:hypothetical protein